ncbi:MAG: hypothetical protein ACPGO3_09920 [Magnetospiraceae bacterium]
MAVLWFDGFDQYFSSGSTELELFENYTFRHDDGWGNVQPAGGILPRTGTRFYYHAATADYSWLARYIGEYGAGAELTAGFGYSFEERLGGDTESPFFQFWSLIGTPRMRLLHDATDFYIRIEIWSETLNGWVSAAQSCDGVLAPQMWEFVEVRLKMHATQGEVEVRVNDETILLVGDLNTVWSDPVRFGGFYTPWQWGAAHDDFYMLDHRGAPSTFLGAKTRVRVAVPTVDGIGNSFSVAGASATGFDALNAQTDEDTDYVYSNVDGAVDLYAHNALPQSTVKIVSAMVMSRARADGGVSRFLENRLTYPGGGTSNQAKHALTPSYHWYTDICEGAPGLAWTVDRASLVWSGFRGGNN